MESRKESAIELIDQAHNEDPKTEEIDGKKVASEFLYSERMVEWLYKMKPDATELEELAARCQHLRRWEIARSEYPMNKPGYYAWRTALYKYQAEHAAKILEKAGYNSDEIEKVKSAVAKSNLRNNEDAQLLEDVACLVFIEFYLADFSKPYEQEKLIKIIQKTWRKMSEKAHELALKIDLSEEVMVVVSKALS